MQRRMTDNKVLENIAGLSLATHDQILKNKDDVEIVVCDRGCARQLISTECKKLKYVQLTSAGYEGLDPKDFAEKGIMLCRAADVYNINMAEFVIYAMLICSKKYHRSIKNRCIRPLRNYHYITELYGKTVGIMGVGNIGGEVASRLSTFGMRVVGYARNTREKVFFERIYHRDEIKEFLSQCDYIVNTLPHSEETVGLLGTEAFSVLKPNIIMVNEGRSSIFDKHAFIHFFKTHPNASAILDMMELIPTPISNPYRRLHNVIVWPGIVASSQEIDCRLASFVAENIDRYQNSQTMLYQL